MVLTPPQPPKPLSEILQEKNRIISLKEISRVARVERGRLQRQLQLLRSGEDSLSREIGTLEGVVRAVTPPPDIEPFQSTPRWGRWLVVILMTQTVAFIIIIK